MTSWHFACSPSGYTDSRINLEWIQHVFDPNTRTRANGKLRILINDGFGTHESLEVMTFCFENNIILCRLPSHPSHKLQPCNVVVFGPLKTAYRGQVEQYYRRGVEAISKEQFTLLCSRARNESVTSRNIRTGWFNAGLFPFAPDRVLRHITRPSQEKHPMREASSSIEFPFPSIPLRTPTSARSLSFFQRHLEEQIDDGNVTQIASLNKIVKAAEKPFADGVLMRDEVQGLLEQNNEGKPRRSLKRNVVGKGEIMSYEDIVAAREDRDRKEADEKRGKVVKSGRKPLRVPAEARSPMSIEMMETSREIATASLGRYCTVLRF